MLESLKVGLSAGAGERLNRSYAYNYFGDVTALTDRPATASLTTGWAVSPPPLTAPAAIAEPTVTMAQTG